MYFDQSDKSSQHVLDFNTSKIGRLVADWLVENMNPDLTRYRLLLDVRMELNIQYWYIDGKYRIYVARLRNGRKTSF